MTDCRFRLAVKNIPARTPGAVDKCGRIFTRRPNCNLQQVRLARAVIATATSVRGSEASKSRDDLHRAIDIRIATRYGAALIDCRHQPINIAPIISFSASLVSRPPIGSAKYCDERVCLSVCSRVRDHIFGTTRLICTKFFIRVTHRRGSFLLWRRNDTLRISGFVDDVIVAHKLIGCSTSPPD